MLLPTRYALPQALGISVLCVVVALVAGWSRMSRDLGDSEHTYYFGSQGVVLIDGSQQMQWDGLWHSGLSDGASHVGTNNWLLAVIPLFCHEPRNNLNTLVIGSGDWHNSSNFDALSACQ